MATAHPQAPRRFALGCGSLPLPDIVTAARQAEDLGYESVWIGGGGELRFDPFVAASAVLGATARVHSGPGIIAVAERHPVALASAALTLDRLAPGRALLGIGRGDKPDPYQQRRDARIDMNTALEEALRICSPLLRGEPVRHDGTYWSAGVDRVPRRMAPQAAIPLALAAVGPRTLRLGGSLADIVLLNYGASPDYVRWAVERIGEGVQRSGRGRTRPQVHGYLLVARTDLPGAAAGLESVGGLLSKLFADPLQAGALARPSGEVPALWDEAACRRFALVGTGAECEARLEEYFDAGLECAILLPSGMRQLHLA